MSARAHLTDPALYRAFYEADMHPGVVHTMHPGEARMTWTIGHLAPTTDVIDVGCHKGEMTGQLPLYTLGRVVGVDISATALADARRFWDRFACGRFVTWACADAVSLPFPSGSFGMAVLNEVLEHVPDVGAVVAEAERVVVPGGVVVVSVPIEALRLDEFDRRQRSRTLGYDLDMHVRELDLATYFRGKSDLVTTDQWHEIPYQRGDGGPQRFGFHLAAYRVPPCG